jgi:hypothetical protein
MSPWIDRRQRDTTLDLAAIGLTTRPGPEKQGASGALPGPSAFAASEGRGVCRRPSIGQSGRVCLGWRGDAPARGQAGAD